MDAGKEIIFLLLQDPVVIGDPRGDKFRNTSFYYFFGQLGIFELVADGHALPGPDQFREVGIESMMGETRQVHIGSGPVGPFGQDYSKDF